MKAKTFLTGLSFGIIGGVVSVLFTTPQSGKQLRANISNFCSSTKDTVNNLLNQTKDVKNSFTLLKNEVEYNIPNIITETKTAFSNFKKETEPNLIHLKEEIENLQNSIVEIENNLSRKDKNGE